MRFLFLSLFAGLVISSHAYAAGIQYSVNSAGVSTLGQATYTYTYFVTGVNLQANQELDVLFDPSLYGTLSNPVAGPGFDVMVFQPNSPTGTFGDYSVLALVNNPPLSGPFSVSFTYLSTGQPGVQTFYINQYDQAGAFIATIDSGLTSAAIDAVPEPSTLVFTGVALALAAIWSTVRRGRRAA